MPARPRTYSDEQIAADGTPGRDRGQTSAAAELGVGRASVHRWVRGGWLLATRGRETGE